MFEETWEYELSLCPMQATTECVVCLEEFTASELAPLCIHHVKHACYGCVMKLRRTKKPCPLCRKRLVNDTDAQALNMTWEEFMKWLDEQVDA